MSILIKALKQAERDHHARAAAAVPAYAASAVLEPDPRPAIAAVPAALPTVRGGAALSLAPVELHEPADAASPPQQRAGANEDANDDANDYGQHEPQDTNADVLPVLPAAAVPQSPYAPPSVDVTARAEAADAAAASPAMRPAARVVAAVLQTTDQGRGSTRAPGSAPIPPMSDLPPSVPPAAPRARAGAAAKPARESTALDDDLQAEQRKAARQLITPAPAGARFRRLAVILTVAVLLAGAAAAAYWQGLFSGLDGLLQSAPPPPPAGNRTLADRLQQSAGTAPEKVAKTHPHTGTPLNPAIAGPVAGRKGVDNSAGAALGIAGTSAAHQGGNAAGTDKEHASDAIHLRTPEATPERIRALLQEAYTSAGRGDTAGASRIYQQVIDLDHNNGDAWIGLAAIAANSGDTAAANHDYRRALEIDPGDSVALGGLLGVQSGVDPQEAESRLRLLIVRDGAQPALQAALGKMLARQGRWLEAQETFYQAWVADPSQPDVAFNLAVTLERIRQPVAALSFYRRALELTQNHSARFDPAVAQERVAALTPKQP
jgi:Flp pilus assembly protein TadD